MADLLLIGMVIGALIAFLILGYAFGSKITRHRINAQWEGQLSDIRKDAINRSRANLGGKFSESLSPYFPDFPFKPTEMRWLGGSPIDYLVFPGMDNDEITSISFIEIKSGKSQLSPRERQIKELVEQKKVSWHLYRVPEHITQVK